MKERGHGRSPEQTQISVNLPRTLLAKIDALAKADQRKRANWIVKKLTEAVEADEARKKLEEGALRVVSGAGDYSSPSTLLRVAEAEEGTPEQIEPDRKPPPMTKARAALRRMAAKEKEK